MAAKVDFLLPSFAAGGAERVMLCWLRVAAAAYDTALLVLRGDGPLRDLVPPATTLVDLAAPRARQAMGPLCRYLRRRQPDLLVSTMAYMNFLALGAARMTRTRTKIVVREANTPPPFLVGGLHATAYRAGYRFLYPGAAAIIAPSAPIREQLIALTVRPGQIREVANPVDVTGLRRRAVSGDATIDVNGRLFVAAGRLVRQKGFDLLLDMARHLDRHDQIWILGDGPECDALAEALPRNMGATVHLKGFVANPAPMVAFADAFLVPSRWEGMPNAALEALALGVPVIASPGSGGLVTLANDAAGGAITIAAPGEQFVAAMRSVRPRSAIERRGVDARPSLLPAAHEAEQSARRFLELIDEVNQAGAPFTAEQPI